MNALESADLIAPAGNMESRAIEEFAAPQRPAPHAPRVTRTRYTLLAVIALLASWLAFSVLSSINEMNAELETIRANISRGANDFRPHPNVNAAPANSKPVNR